MSRLLLLAKVMMMMMMIKVMMMMMMMMMIMDDDDHLPLPTYIPVGPSGDGEDRKLVTRGLYIGDDAECFFKAAELSIQVNFTLLDEPLDKVCMPT